MNELKCWLKKTYLAGQLDFTTRPLLISVFIQFHPVYQSLGELPKCPAFSFAFSGLNQKKERRDLINLEQHSQNTKSSAY